ncbi:PhoPQ-activated pathogenicity protein [Planctomycetales bacterium]|nr:PhoPQ-activated pathogenicity protein [Planctomycetales bacterium]
MISRILLPVLAIVFSCGITAAQQANGVPPILEQYVKADDGVFRWENIKELPSPLPTVKLTLLEVTSIKWHDYTWKHKMIAAMPEKPVSVTHALMYISQNNNDWMPGDGDFKTAAVLASKIKLPVCILFQVPNQPCDPRKTAQNDGQWVESHLLAESIIKAMETNDPTWAVPLPMTKSVLKSMTAAQEFFKQRYEAPVNSLIVGGSSKRGWITWLVGASKDPRVAGLIPVIYNNLNLPAQINGQAETWGYVSPQIVEFSSRDVLNPGEVPSDGKALMIKVLDPYYHLDTMKTPKLLIHGANDPYWLVDATKYYYDKIQGPKFLITVPDMAHQDLDSSANLSRLGPSVGIFCRRIASGDKFPTLTWDLKDKGQEWEVTIHTEIPGTKKILWTAYCDDNQFTKEKPQRVQWSSKELGDADSITVPKPSKGHIAFFVELRALVEDEPLGLTTEVWRF